MSDQAGKQSADGMAPAPKPPASLIDKPLFIALVSSLISATVAIFSVSMNVYTNERNAQRAAEKAQSDNLKDDIKLVTSQFELLTKPDSPSHDLAYTTIRYIQSRYRPEENPSAHKFFENVLTASSPLAARNGESASVRAQAAMDIAQKAQPESAAPAVANAGPVVRAETGTLAAADPRAVSKPSVAYIQYYCEAQKRAALALQTGLLNAGVPAPGTENVLAKHQGQAAALKQLGRPEPEVRFFYAGDEDAAKFAAKLLGDTLGAPSVFLRNLSGRYRNAGIKSGMVEVWLPYSSQTCPG